MSGPEDRDVAPPAAPGVVSWLVGLRAWWKGRKPAGGPWRPDTEARCRERGYHISEQGRCKDCGRVG
jgi:hypothetical protein